MVQLIHKGNLTGHTDWVTGVATSHAHPNTVVTCSRDKKVIVWELTPNGEQPGVAKKALTAHNGAVSDLALSSDGNFALTSVCGIWQLVSLLRPSTLTLVMFSPLGSPPITDKSFPLVVISPSSCGTPLVSVNTPSRKTSITTGFLAFVSLLPQSNHSSFLLVGIRSSRSGI